MSARMTCQRSHLYRSSAISRRFISVSSVSQFFWLEKAFLLAKIFQDSALGSQWSTLKTFESSVAILDKHILVAFTF